MVEYGLPPEAMGIIVDYSRYAMLAIGAMAFTLRQRQAIRARDKQECQMDCEAARFCGKGNDPLEVHHVLPQAYSRQYGVDPDYPENAVSVCRTFHQEEIHNTSLPDAQQAIRERRPYWNTEHDRKLSAIAVRNTQRARKKGWIFPPK